MLNTCIRKLNDTPLHIVTCFLMHFSIFIPPSYSVPETAHDNGVFTGGIPTVHFLMQEIPDLQTIYLAVGNASVDCDFTIRCSAQKGAGSGMGMPPVVLHQLLEGVPQVCIRACVYVYM